MTVYLPRLDVPSRRYPWYVLAVACLGMLMAALDTGSVSAAYPSLAAAFDVPAAVVSWVGIAYLTTATTLLAIVGRLADLAGQRRIMLAGYAVFLAGSLLAALAPGIGWLLGARVVCGVGSAMLVANAVGLIGAHFPAARRGMAIGTLETSVAAGLAVGPILAGYLIDQVGWRAIFFVNWPIGWVGLALGGLVLRDDGARRREPFDFLGAATFGLGMVSLLLGLTSGATLGWGSPLVVAAFGLALGLLPLFLAVERRVRYPMLALSLFAHREFAAANAAKVCGYLSMMCGLFTAPFYLQRVLDLTPAQVGLALTPVPIGLTVASLTMGPLSDRIGSRRIAPAALAVAAVGCLLLATVSPAGGYPAFCLALLVLTLGIGSFIAPNDSAILAAAPRDELGVAGGILAMTRSIGQILGLAVAGTVLSARLPLYEIAGLATREAFVAAYHDVFKIALAVAVLGALASLVPSRARDDP